MRRLQWAPLAVCLASIALAQTSGDTVLRAMRDELDRSRGLKMLALEAPYFIEYSIEDASSFEAAATLGGLLSVRHDRFRVPEINVRVGGPKFDNTDYLGSPHAGAHYDIGRFPIENSYEALRRYLWLETDSAYKGAVEAIARKRAALKNVAVSEPLDDFAPAPPLKKLLEVRHVPLDEEAWPGRVRSLSAIFEGYPSLLASSVQVQAGQSVHYYVNSEGTEVRVPEDLIFLVARADAQAPDGMLVHDAAIFQALDFGRLPSDAELRRGVTALAADVTALAGAPRGDEYAGPVLFEGRAAAQLFAEVLGENLAPARRPVADPGRSNFVARESELQGRRGARILPEWMDVVDDPTQKEWQGRPLFGSYEVDREGVAPVPLTLVEKGVLKTFLMTRQPMPGLTGSNGRARLPGAFGANTAAISNLFVRASETSPAPELKRQLIDICKQRGKPYGMVVRKLDFPSSASVAEIRRLMGENRQDGGQLVSAPVLAYRVYTDGREELVRGLSFRGLDARSLKDILSAGDDNKVFEFLNNDAPLALIGGARFVAETSVIAPSVLVDDLDLRPIAEELPKLPIVPPPDLEVSRK